MKRWLLLLSVMVLGVSSACVDLAGDPVIVGTVPADMFAQPPTPADVVPPAIVADLQLGARVYAENCVRCHGDSGAGDGEFVLSGQITEIVNFTDLAATEGKTPAMYYEVVTVGRLEKLMPPFPSLTDEERWAVANYVFTLAGRDIAELPIATAQPQAPVATEESDAPEATAASAEGIAGTGTIFGVVRHGTAGSSIPADLVLTLHMVDSAFAETTFPGTLAEDGSFSFADVPIQADTGYFVSARFAEEFFTSQFLSFTDAENTLNADITLYERTDDPSVIQVVSAITQFDVIGDRLQMLQLITVTNMSDRIFVMQDSSGEEFSLRLPAPVGARPTADNDAQRLKWVGADNAYYDRRPVVPGETHTLHVMYDLPFDRSASISQQFDYAFTGPFEVYVNTASLRVEGEGWVDLGTQTLGSVSYSGKGQMPDGTDSFAYTILSTAPWITLDRGMLSYFLLGSGVTLIAVAGVLYVYGRLRPQTAVPVSAPAAPAQPTQATVEMDALMRQITDLDDRFKSGSISEKQYKQQRNDLKTRLSAVMKQVR